MKNWKIILIGCLSMIILIDVWVMGLPLIVYSFHSKYAGFVYLPSLTVLLFSLGIRNRTKQLLVVAVSTILLGAAAVIAAVERDCIGVVLVTGMPFLIFSLLSILWEIAKMGIARDQAEKVNAPDNAEKEG